MMSAPSPVEPHVTEPTSWLEADASIRDLSGWGDIRRENEGPDPFVVASRPGSMQMSDWTPMGPDAMEEDVGDY